MRTGIPLRRGIPDVAQRDQSRDGRWLLTEDPKSQAARLLTGAVAGGRLSGPFPRIPTLAPRGIEEAARAFGLRAFEFLMRERVVAALLDTDVLEQALAASHLIVVASEMADTVREQLHTVRLDIAATIDRRTREQRELAAGVETLDAGWSSQRGWTACDGPARNDGAHAHDAQ